MMVTEEFVWDAGARGTTQLDELHAAGVPVRGWPEGPIEGGLLLYVTSKACHVPVRPGDHIVGDEAGWHVDRAPTAEEAEVQRRVDEADERSRIHDPGVLIEGAPPALPGLALLTLHRVAYRRLDAERGEWELRHGGLSVAEMEQGDWEPLYAAHSPRVPRRRPRD